MDEKTRIEYSRRFTELWNRAKNGSTAALAAFDIAELAARYLEYPNNEDTWNTFAREICLLGRKYPEGPAHLLLIWTAYSIVKAVEGKEIPE